MPTIEYYKKQITNAKDKEKLDKILNKMRKQMDYETKFFGPLGLIIHDKTTSLIKNHKTGNDTFGRECKKGGKRKRKTLKRKRSKKTKNNKKSRKSKRKMTRRIR